MAKIRVMALEFGTFAGVGGSIYHFNPESSEQNARFPVIEEEDFPRAVRDGLAKKLDEDAVAAFKLKEHPTNIDALWDQIMARQAAEQRDAEDEIGLAGAPGINATSLDTRTTTAHPLGDKSNVGAIGLGDPDAAPGATLLAPRAPALTPTGGEGGGADDEILSLSVAKLTQAIATETDIETLKALKAAEAAKPEGGRTGAKAAIDARIEEIEKAAQV